MLSIPKLGDVDAVLAVARMFAPLEVYAFSPLLQAMRYRDLEPEEVLFHVGQVGVDECIVLRGLLRTSVSDVQGREVTLGFHSGPSVLPPSITRTAGGSSRVDCTALEPSRVALFDPAVLTATMLRTPAVQHWGDAVLRNELMRKADREWSLAALPGLERLQQLRREMPDLEERVPHRLIARYLGMTPVTLSRLRGQLASIQLNR